MLNGSKNLQILKKTADNNRKKVKEKCLLYHKSN